MKNSLLQALDWSKYAYILVFFALMAGLFNPFVNNASGAEVAAGVLVLIIGLAGGIFVFKGFESQKRGLMFGIGFGLMAISLAAVFGLTGRF